MKTERKKHNTNYTRRKKHGGDTHKHIKNLLHKLRKEVFESKYTYFKEIISNHNEETKKSNKRDLKKYEPLFSESASSEEINTIIQTFKTCSKFIHKNKDKIAKEFFKIYSNHGIAHRDLFIKKHILKDFIKELETVYLQEENRSIISNPNQGYFSTNKDYSDDRVYLDHIKRNYVDAFELPTNIKNDMLHKKDSQIYIIPRVTLVNIGTIHHYKDGLLKIEKNKINTIVSKDEFKDLYIPKEYKAKREKFLTKTKKCTKDLEDSVKNYKIHIKTTDSLSNIEKLLNENTMTKEEIRISTELDQDEMDGGK